MDTLRWKKMEFRFTRHAGEEAKRRGIAMDTITEVMNHPLAIVDGYGSRKIYQGKIVDINGKQFLIRAVVDINTAPISIVTVYRTSKMAKYEGDV
jgi:hypothetical protein